MAKKRDRLPPLRLTEDRHDSLQKFIEEQLLSFEKSAIDYWTLCRKIDDDYELKPEHPVKNFPVPNSSNVVVPTIPARVDAVVSRINNAVFGGTTVVSIKPLRNETQFVEAAPILEDFLERQIHHGIEPPIYVVWNDGFLCEVKCGTSFFEISHEVETREYETYNEKAEVERKRVSLYEGPREIFFPPEYFRITPGYYDLQRAPLVGRKIPYSNEEFLWAIENKHFKDILDGVEGEDRWSRARSLMTQRPPEYEEDRASKEGIELVIMPYHDIYKLYVSFDIHGDGLSQEIMLFYHRQSRKILNAWWNPLKPVRRPLHVERYIKREGRLFGIGIGQRGKGMSDEITTIHRQGIDASRLALTNVVVARESMRSQIGQMWMGKALYTPNPSEDLKIQSLGAVNPASLTLQQFASSLLNEAVGLQDIQQGAQPQGRSARPVGRDTMARIQEANKRIDWQIRDIRESKGHQLQDIMMHYIQFVGFDYIEQVLGQEKSNKIKFLWDHPSDMLENFGESFAFGIFAASASQSREQDLQMNAQAQAMMTAFNDRMLKFVQASSALPPEGKQLLSQVYAGERTLLVRQLTRLGVPDAERQLPSAQDLIGGKNAAHPQPGASPQPGGVVSSVTGQSGVPPADGTGGNGVSIPGANIGPLQ